MILSEPQDLDAVAEDLRAGLKVFPAIDFANADLPALRQAAHAAFMAAPMPDDIPVDACRVELSRADGPPIGIETYRPRGGSASLPAILHMHSGGYVMGSPLSSRDRHMRLANELGCFIASVDYRLSPETRFPGALDDCYAALTWLAELPGIDASRIALLGESAGGGLAASLALLARDRGGLMPCLQCLVYPMLDDRTCLDQGEHPYVGKLVWTREHNRFGWASLLGDAPGGAGVSPYAAAARADDLSRLPPAFLAVGSLDLFLEENIEYVRRLSRAGVSVEMHLYPGSYHGFTAIPDAAASISANGAIIYAIRRAFENAS